MANPWHHSVSSSRKWGGEPEDYLHIHEWFDESKGWLPDFRHRSMRHHSEGIAEAVKLFQPIAIVVRGSRWHAPTCRSHWDLIQHKCTCGRKVKTVPVRWVAEQHVMEDLGRIPTAADWLRSIKPEPWMAKARKLSRELEEGDGPVV